MDLVDTLLLDIILKFYAVYHLDSRDGKVTDIEILCYKFISNM